MMLIRSVAKFCRTKPYIERFSKLQQEVNRLQSEFISKKQLLDQLRQVNTISNQDKLKKYIGWAMNQPFESSAMLQQKQRSNKLHKQLEDLMEDGKNRSAIAQRMKKQQQNQRQVIFLSDLARFCQKYQQVVHFADIDKQVHVGVQLSHKSLENILQKEGVRWIGVKDQKFNPQIHEQVQGQGSTVKQVLQSGFKIKQSVIKKAKVAVKK